MNILHGQRQSHLLSLRMRNLGRLTAIISLGLSSPLMAQGSAATLEHRIKSIDAKRLADAECTLQIARAASANGPDLIYGGALCDALMRPVESSFLMVVGQIRASVDILLLPPATQLDDHNLSSLYGLLYFGGGAAGTKDEVLRDPTSRASYFKLFDAWEPVYANDYDPGWTARKRPDVTKYASTVAEAKAGMRTNLERVVRLVSDDRYYALHRQRQELLERNRDGIPQESPDGMKFNDLSLRIRDRMVALGVEAGPTLEDANEAANAEANSARASRNFPPASPENGETVVAGPLGPTVETCRDMAERVAVNSGGKIARVLVTSSPKWGTILRADIVGGDGGGRRYTCTESTSASQPLGILAALPGDATLPAQ